MNFTQAAGEALATITGDDDMGPLTGIDIVVTYPEWPRAWQAEAEALRSRFEKMLEAEKGKITSQPGKAGIED